MRYTCLFAVCRAVGEEVKMQRYSGRTSKVDVDMGICFDLCGNGFDEKILHFCVSLNCTLAFYIFLESLYLLHKFLQDNRYFIFKCENRAIKFFCTWKIEK